LKVVSLKVSVESFEMIIEDGRRKTGDEMVEGRVGRQGRSLAGGVFDDAGAEVNEKKGEREKEKSQGNADPFVRNGGVGINESTEVKEDAGGGEDYKKKESADEGAIENRNLGRIWFLSGWSECGDGTSIRIWRAEKRAELAEVSARREGDFGGEDQLRLDWPMWSAT
jgi:hypothetical protein